MSTFSGADQALMSFHKTDKNSIYEFLHRLEYIEYKIDAEIPVRSDTSDQRSILYAFISELISKYDEIYTEQSGNLPIALQYIGEILKKYGFDDNPLAEKHWTKNYR